MAKKNEVLPLVFENTETGETVTVEYNRAIILRMEREGYPMDKIADLVESSPISTTATLFWYGMLMHQPNTTREEAEEFLFDNVAVDDKFIGRLAELLAKPYNDLIDAQRKNSRWTIRK